MRRKAKELQQARRDAERSGKKVPAFGGFGSAGMTSVSSGSIISDSIIEPEKPKMTPAAVRYASEGLAVVVIAGVSEGGALSSSLSSRPSGPSKALKLGAKGKEVDNFVDKLKSEGETIMSNTGKRSSDVSKALPPPVNVERYGHVVSARTRLDAHIWSSGSTKKINLLKCYVTIMKPRSRNMNYCYL